MTEFSRVTPSLAVRSLDASLSFYTGLLSFTVDTLWSREEATLAILDHGPVNLRTPDRRRGRTPGDRGGRRHRGGMPA